MADYLGLRGVSYLDSTETGGSSYLVHVGHAAAAIAAGACSVALVTLAGKPRTGGAPPGGSARIDSPEGSFEVVHGINTPGLYALAARRHMHEHGTTAEQLAMVKVAASQHAQHNPHAFLPQPVTVEEVLDSPMVADPLHRLDCCVVTDGGGALVLVSPDVARSLDRHAVPVLGHGEAPKHTMGRAGRPHLHRRGLVGPARLRRGGPHPRRRRLRLRLRLLHHHRHRDHRGPGVLRQGRGRPLRGRRRPAGPARPPALQTPTAAGLCNNHPAQPRGHDQGDRGRAPAARARPTPPCRCPTARSPWPTARAARSAPAWAAPPCCWGAAAEPAQGGSSSRAARARPRAPRGPAGASRPYTRRAVPANRAARSASLAPASAATRWKAFHSTV